MINNTLNLLHNLFFFLIVYYYTYFLLAGMILCVLYLRTEKKIVDIEEFFLLLFSSLTGYGNWIYNRTIRNKGISEMPKKWFVYDKMNKLNKYFLLYIVTTILLFILYTKLPHESNNDNNIPNGFLNHLAVLPKLLSGLIETLFALILFVPISLILLSIIILVPIFKKKNMEKKIKAKQLLQESQKGK